MLVELDGIPWRELPAAAIAAAGLDVGVHLDRPCARRLRRALVEQRLTTAAGKALGRRPLSRRQLTAALERVDAPAAARRDLVDRLDRTGLIDDSRLAAEHAAQLGRRGWGDEGIVARLEAQGIPAELARTAVASLAPESERAVTLLAGTRASGPRHQAALLVRRGFSHDTIGQALRWDEHEQAPTGRATD